MSAPPRLLGRAARLLLSLTIVTALAACEAGSRSVSPEYYTITTHATQDADGAVIVTGDTDLPDGSEIDALLTRPGPVERAVDEAILIGSTDEEPISRPIRNGRFTIRLTRVLTNSCGIQPPCGPWPAGGYRLLLDARTPAGPIGSAYTTYDDPRYLSTTHGVAGFTGIEISQPLTLRPIRLCLDAQGELRTDGCGTG